MNIIFSDHPVPHSITKSIFLAGPSPRELGVPDWRHQAIAYLESIHFDGSLFVPVPEKRFYGGSDGSKWSYNDQVEWECKCRHVADIILFWVPRDIAGKMPAFVTNIEFGEDLGSGKIVYGRPVTAEKCKYLDKRMLDDGLPIFETLESTFDHALSLLGNGAYREKGEVNVPLYIWKSEQFQHWYKNLTDSGNSLVDAKVLSHVLINQTYLFAYTLWVNIWVDSEQRYKENEFIFSRKDVSTVVAYYTENNETKVLLVKEFRSAVNNTEGFVYELPGGSVAKLGTDPLINAQDELKEEAGLLIEDTSRFEWVNTRQLVATLSTHQSHVYKVKLNQFEYQQLLGNISSKSSFGNAQESELTYISMVDLKELKNSLVDYSVLGMIYEAIDS